MPASQPVTPQGPSISASRTSPADKQLLYALVLLCALAFVFADPGLVIRRGYGKFTTDVFYMRGFFRFYVALLAGLATGWLAQPAISAYLERWRENLSASARRVIVGISVALACMLAALFVIHFGREQFGGWDYNILVDVGWRQILGQRPYVDFVTPTPPLFNWTAALAFRLFGVTWNANLYLSALFTAGALVWTFFLLRRLGMRAFAALATASVMQTAAMLTCSFWWYNNTTLVLAALFYLSAVLLARAPGSRLGQISYVLLLGIVPLTKPNIAGVTIAGCVVLLLLASRRPAQILLLTGAGVVLSALLFLALHIPLSAMIATYRGIAKERGGLSTFGYDSLAIGEQRMTQLWMAVLFVPLISIVGPIRQDIEARNWRSAAFWFFFPLAWIVAIYGIAGNGELRDVECTLLFSALALLAFVYCSGRAGLRRLTVALLCAAIAADLYTGVARLRVYTIGPHMFFEWQDNQHLFASGFLKDLRGSETLVEVDQQVREAVSASPGSTFFGPRLDFEYAVLGLPSPIGWVSFFQPGTAFGRQQTVPLLQGWLNDHFQTLIFLKGDYTFYPDPFLKEIRAEYIRDDRYPRLTVYHRRPGT